MCYKDASPYNTGRLLRRGFRLKSEARDRTLARTGPTTGENSCTHRRQNPKQKSRPSSEESALIKY